MELPVRQPVYQTWTNGCLLNTFAGAPLYKNGSKINTDVNEYESFYVLIERDIWKLIILLDEIEIF